LWRNIAREFAEEFLSLPDLHGSTPRPLDYSKHPDLAKVEAAYEAGTARPFLLGIGNRPLTLKAEVLTALVIDHDAFEAILGGGLKPTNLEGQIVGPMRFTHANMSAFAHQPNILPAGSATLQLAWEHIDALMS